MQRVVLICVGKLKERFYAEAAAEYVKRLGRFCKLEIVELPEERLPQDPSPAQVEAALLKEAQAIRDRLPHASHLVALCVEGRQPSSEELARLMASWGEKRLVFLIGGSFGLHDSIKAEANASLSMSSMTFPHHLARVMLLEQVYRAYQINAGSRYHKWAPPDSEKKPVYVPELFSQFPSGERSLPGGNDTDRPPLLPEGSAGRGRFAF